MTYDPRWTFQLITLLPMTCFCIPMNFLASSPIIGATPAITNWIWIPLCQSTQSYQHQRQTTFYTLSHADFCCTKQHLLSVLPWHVAACPATFPISIRLTKAIQFRATSFVRPYFLHFFGSQFLFLSLSTMASTVPSLSYMHWPRLYPRCTGPVYFPDVLALVFLLDALTPLKYQMHCLCPRSSGLSFTV